jgi:AcrR family transcriptional regulator
LDREVRFQVTPTRIQQVRRDDVVRAAVAVVDRDGYAAASIARIAEEAGTSKGTVLYHFSNRAAVDQAVVDGLFADGAAYMGERILAAGSVRDRLAAYVSSNLRFIGERAAHVRAVHAILANTRAAAGGGEAVGWLRDLLAEGQRAGELHPGFDPLVVALVIRAVVDAASHYLTEQGDLDLDHYVDEAVRLFDRATEAR